MCGETRNIVGITLQLFSHLIWIAGLVVGGSGFFLLLKYGEHSWFFSQAYITLPGILAICSAASLFIAGYFGSWISFRDSHPLQGLFVYLLVVVFCLESTTAALAYYHKTELVSETAPLKEMFQNYTGQSQDINSLAIDITQYKLKCCGVRNYTDWIHTPWFSQTGTNSAPLTCCKTSSPSCNGTLNEPWRLYSQGCQVKLEKTFHFILSLIILSSVVGFLIEVILLVAVAQLMKRQQFVGYDSLPQTKPTQMRGDDTKERHI